MDKQKILIADDSEINREILAGMLDDTYEIEEAKNGLEAMQILKEHAYEFSLVMLDIIMPEYSGFDVLSYMNQHSLMLDVPVIVISTATDSKYVNKAYDLGAVDFVGKPFNANIVKRRIRNTIELYQRQQLMSKIIAEEIYEKTKGYDQMVSILSQVVEFRNHESGMHVLHIRKITDMLLNQLVKKTDKYKLTSEDITMINLASALHDIGKITVPDEILNKPGRLTKEEFEEIKKHAANGEEMLRSINGYGDDALLKLVRDICRWHHERYDGKGYPDGLEGDSIPISAQVVAVADVYDALTSERCYKKAYSHEKAMEMILNGECGSFNPILMECLVEIKDRLPTALEQNDEQRAEEREMQLLTDEILQKKELSSSVKLVYQLQFAEARGEYFQETAGGMSFVYRESPSLLTLSNDLAALLNTKRLLPEPMNDKTVSGLFRYIADRWNDEYKQNSLEQPDFDVEYDLHNSNLGKKT